MKMTTIRGDLKTALADLIIVKADLVTVKADLTTVKGDGASGCIAQSSVVSSGIPNNTQTGGTICTATGDVLIEDISFNMDATGFAAPTNIEITTDNVKGKTGAAAPIFLEAIAAFGANLTGAKADATSHTLPMVLESGKSLFIHGDNAAGTGAGVGALTIIGRPVTLGAILTGADIAAP